MTTNSLMQKLMSSVKDEYSAPLNDSKVFGKSEMADTGIPMLNVALSGMLDGGLTPGLHQIAGPSKHFKTMFALLLAAGYQRKYKDAVLVFFDSEFGAPEQYFDATGIDRERVFHVPIQDVDELKFKFVNILKNVKRGDHYIFIIDSIGNLASIKEVEDAENEKAVTDMSRAKAMKSLGRIITPRIKLKDVPVIAINHTYKEIGLYPKDVVGGGTGLYYSADEVWIIGRQQEKDGKDIAGYHFVIKADKSRYIRENSKIPILVTFEGGVKKWSGLFDIAVEGGFIQNPKMGWYQVTGEEKMLRAKDLVDNDEFWEKMIRDEKFKNYIIDQYKLKDIKIEGQSKDNGIEIEPFEE